jgi:hypothetical protein
MLHGRRGDGCVSELAFLLSEFSTCVFDVILCRKHFYFQWEVLNLMFHVTWHTYTSISPRKKTWWHLDSNQRPSTSLARPVPLSHSNMLLGDSHINTCCHGLVDSVTDSWSEGPGFESLPRQLRKKEEKGRKEWDMERMGMIFSTSTVPGRSWEPRPMDKKQFSDQFPILYGRSLEIPNLDWDVPGTSTGGIVLIGRSLSSPIKSTALHRKKIFFV